jgi:hypothetical protein
VTNTLITNITCSIYMKLLNTTLTNAYVCMQINMNQSNGTGILNAGAMDCKYITRTWEWYATTRELSAAHTNFSILIYPGQNNISVWGAQCEPNTKFPSSYAGVITTSPVSTWTNYVRSTAPLYVYGTITSTAGISGTTITGSTSIAGGTVAGTTGTFSSYVVSSSYVDSNVPNTGNSLGTHGIVGQAATAATAAAPNQNSAAMELVGNVWNVTGISVTHRYFEIMQMDNWTRSSYIIKYLNHPDNTNHTFEIVNQSFTNGTLVHQFNGNITFPNIQYIAGNTVCFNITNSQIYVNTTCP